MNRADRRGANDGFTGSAAILAIRDGKSIFTSARHQHTTERQPILCVGQQIGAMKQAAMKNTKMAIRPSKLLNSDYVASIFDHLTQDGCSDGMS